MSHNLLEPLHTAFNFDWKMKRNKLISEAFCRQDQMAILDSNNWDHSSRQMP